MSRLFGSKYIAIYVISSTTYFAVSRIHFNLIINVFIFSRGPLIMHVVDDIAISQSFIYQDLSYA